jgi:hypothetical protein
LKVSIKALAKGVPFGLMRIRTSNLVMPDHGGQYRSLIPEGFITRKPDWVLIG